MMKASDEQRPLDPDQLIGTWRLQSCEGRSADGQVIYPYGEAPEGMLMYDAHGHMIVILMRRSRPLFVGGDVLRGTAEELRAAFEGFDAYCGTYTLDVSQATVTHHLVAARFPNWVGTDQVRHVTLRQDRLALSTPPILGGGTEWTFSLIWQPAM
jgi:hypothetical protein